MADAIETVRVATPITDDNSSGYYLVNKEDFASPMELYSEPKPAKSDSPKTDKPKAE